MGTADAWGRAEERIAASKLAQRRGLRRCQTSDEILPERALRDERAVASHPERKTTVPVRGDNAQLRTLDRSLAPAAPGPLFWKSRRSGILRNWEIRKLGEEAKRQTLGTQTPLVTQPARHANATDVLETRRTLTSALPA